MRSVLIILGSFVAIVLVAVAAALFWILRPDVLQTYVLDSVRDRTGVDIEVGALNLGLDGVLLREVVVFEPRTPPEDTAPRRVLGAREIAVRPSWRDLILNRRVVILYAAVDGLDLAIHRDAKGESNLGRLINAFTQDEEGRSAPGPTGHATDPEAPAAIELDRLILTHAKIGLIDLHERPTHPLALRLEIHRLGFRGLADSSPNPFHLDATVSLGQDFESSIKGTGTAGFSPIVIDTDLSLDELNVDTLVTNLANPDDPEIPGPLPLEGIRVTGRLEANRVQYESFDFTEVKAVATLDGTKLTVSRLETAVAGGSGVITADIDFGLEGFRYGGTAKLVNVHLARARGMLEPLAWGRTPDPKASVEVELRMAGTTGERLLDTIDLDAKVEIDALDIDSLVERNTPGESRDVGPLDTGDGSIRVALQLGAAYADPYLLDQVSIDATLDHSHLNISSASASLAGGTIALSGAVDFTRPGLGYGGSIHLANAQAGALSAPIGESLGRRTGVVGAELTFEGHGTNRQTLLRNMNADGQFSWTDGRVTDSNLLKDIASITGIPGFRDLIVQNSGGKLQVREGVLSSERIRIWGPDAGIQASGTVHPDLEVDAQIALGIGPHSNRELFSTGIALPYVNGDDGWRFVPVHVRGNLEDPKLTIPPRAVLKSALTTVPAAGVGVVSTGLGVVRGGTRAVLHSTASVIPGSGPVVRGSEAVVDESTGAVGGIVKRGAGAVGSVFRGIGNLFGSDTDEIGSSDDPEDAH